MTFSMKQPCCVQVLDDASNEIRRDGQVEETISLETEVLIQAVEFRFERSEAFRFCCVALLVINKWEQLAGIWFCPFFFRAMFLNGLPDKLSKLFVGHRSPSRAEDGVFVRHVAEICE